MKKTRIALLLCFVLLFNMVFVGCTAKSLSADISDYTIVTPAKATDYEINAAQYIQEQIKELTGKKLDIVKDSQKQKSNEILVGLTNRELSKESSKTNTQGLQFVINSKGSAISIYGYKFLVAGAAYRFVEEYFKDGKFNNNIPQQAKVYVPTPQKAKNYFLLIGDGMGPLQTRLFEFYDSKISNASDNERMFYGYLLPNIGDCKTDSNNGTTDSAAAATALATGFRTENGYVGIDRDGNELKSLTELAVELGFKTAVMSTEDSTGATPAGFSAHTESRKDTVGIKACQEELSTTKFVCGLNSLSFDQCEQAVRNTLKKLENEKGTFLMYEEAYIDKYCHGGDIDMAFLMLIRFNQAIGAFMEYALYNPDTMIIITADHETGGLEIGEDGKPQFTTGSHTSEFVKVFGFGVGTEKFNGQKMRNIEIPKFIAANWGVNNFGDQSSK